MTFEVCGLEAAWLGGFLERAYPILIPSLSSPELLVYDGKYADPPAKKCKTGRRYFQRVILFVRLN